MTAVSPRRLRGRWIASCAAGEVIGITAAAAIAVGGRVWIGEPDTFAEAAALLAALVAGGAIEGMAVGWFQWRVLRRVLPSLGWRAWVGATVAVAALLWLLGMLPSTILGLAGAGGAATDASPQVVADAGPPLLLVVGAGVVGGALAGAGFGLAQWAVLRRHARRAAGWVGTNALGWAVGLGWIMLAASAPDASTPLPVVVAAGTAAGLAAGISVGVVTTWSFVRFESSRSGRQVVIGIGNSFRGDDGVGPCLVADLEAKVGDRVDVLALDGEPARVVEAWRGADLAVVVDAMSACQAPGTIRRIRLGEDPLPEPVSGTSSHSLGVAEAVELGRALGAMPRELVVYAVEGAAFGEGSGLSAPVDAARGRLAADVLAELGA